MESMPNAVIALLFTELADLLEVQGENPFRVRAYRTAARTIESCAESLAALRAQPGYDLTELPGIGKDLALKIVEILESGQLTVLTELKAKLPPDVTQMLRIPGLGPKKVKLLIDQLHVRTLEDLQAACEQHRVSELKGFGQKTEQSILEGLEQLSTAGQRVLLSVASVSGEAIVDSLRQLPEVDQISMAGSCRRRKETCKDLDVLVTAQRSQPVMDALAAHPLVEKVLARGDTKQRVRLRNGLELDLRVVPAESYGAALQYFTGSKEHNIEIRKRALERGLKINEYGVFRGDEPIAGATEAEVYAAVGLDWIPPELRENRGEIQLAADHRLPTLVTVADIQGDLHLHTTATDGVGTIQDMAEAAAARGLKYIAITDHSKRVAMANGLDAVRLRAHWAHIRELRDQLAARPGIELLCGIECDILEDATLDLPDEVLAEADWVLAVLHYGLKQPREQIQQRLLAAIRNPHVDAIGHPSGRLIGSRPGANIDYSDFLKAAADHGVLLEINSNPQRLDLDDIHVAAAKERGIPIVISTDSHSPNGYDVLPYGVDVARRAGLTRDDVANARPWSELKHLLRS
jgi:DNA polymerase (family X)